MPQIDLGTLLVNIEADNTQAKAAIQEVGNVSKEVTTSSATNWKEMGTKLSSIGADLTKKLTLPLLAAGGAAIKYASDLNETMSKAEVVFGTNSDAVKKWSQTSIDKMGLAQQTALDMAAGFGDMGTSMGLSTDESYKMSTSLVQLAADMASFKNISTERAQSALNAIYTGETESLKAMGIVMTDANLQAFAMANGITKNISAMTQAEKVQLRYKYVMANTANAQGDFARTGDSVANQSRKMGETLKQVAANFGNVLLPVVADALKGLNNFLQGFMNLDDGTKKTIVTIAAVVAAIGPMISIVGGAITAVEGLTAAFTFIAANPIVLVIGGIVAALALLAGAFVKAKMDADNTATALDVLNEKKVSAEVSVDTTAADTNIATTSTNLDNINARIAEARVNVESKTAEERAQAVESKLATILGYDQSNITLQMTVDTFLQNGNGVQQLLSNMMLTNGNYKSSVDAVIAGIDESMGKQINLVKAFYANQLLQVVALKQQGLITPEEAETQYAAIKGKADTVINGITATGDNAKKTIDGIMNNGLPETFADYEKMLGAVGDDITNMATPAEQAATNLNNLNQRAELGDAPVSKLDGDLVSLKDSLSKTATTMDGELSTALSTATTSMDGLNTAEQADLDALDGIISAQGQKGDALLRYAETVKATGDDYDTNVQTIKSLTKEEQDYLIQTYGSLENAARQNSTTLYNDALAAQNQYGIMLNNKESDRAKIKADYDAKRLTAETKLGEDINKIGSGWTVEELEMMKTHFKDVGDKEGVALTERLQKYEAGKEGMLKEQATGNGEYLTKAKAFVADVGDLDGKATTAGTGVGGALGRGMWKALDEWLKPIVAKAVEIVKKAVEAAKKEGEVNSPSKKMAREVGSPLGEGLIKGWEETIEPMKASIRSGVSKVVSVGNVSAKDAVIQARSMGRAASTTNTKNTSVVQNNTFTSRTLSPFEQREQLRRMNKDLVRAF